jgi:hypothetical protein
MKKFIRKFCLWFLKEELDKERKEVENVREENKLLLLENAEYKKFHVLPRSLFMELLRVIPDPKCFKANPEKKVDLVLHVVPPKTEAHPYDVGVQFTAVDENHLHIVIKDLGTRFNVECILKSGKYDCYGVTTEITAWFWNFNKSGLTIVSDADFFMITEFIEAQNAVLS